MNKANLNYPNEVSHDVIITEIMRANEWFVDINEPEELIREEVKRQFKFYMEESWLL